MVSKMIRATMAAVLGLAAVVVTASAADDLPDIKGIMKIAHSKTDGYLGKISTATKGKKWDDAQKYAKDLVMAGAALGKNKPPKGDQASWDKLTKKYAENTVAVEAGTEKKDAKATLTALGAIQMSCGGCHKAHK